MSDWWARAIGGAALAISLWQLWRGRHAVRVSASLDFGTTTPKSLPDIRVKLRNPGSNDAHVESSTLRTYNRWRRCDLDVNGLDLHFGDSELIPAYGSGEAVITASTPARIAHQAHHEIGLRDDAIQVGMPIRVKVRLAGARRTFGSTRLIYKAV